LSGVQSSRRDPGYVFAAAQTLRRRLRVHGKNARAQRGIVIEYTSDKKLSINHQDVALSELEERLRSIYEQRRDKTMFIIGAGTLHYGDIVTEGMRKAAG
jgi:biopolymer transport protein ExbD